MADSPSWGGHLYAVAATTDGFTGDNPVPAPGITPGPGWGCNSFNLAWWVDPVSGARSRQPSCVPDPALGQPYGGAFEPTKAQYVPTILDRLDAARLACRIYVDNPAGGGWAICPSFAECADTPQHNSVVSAKNVIADAQAGRLPAFAVIASSAVTSQHNSRSMAAGDNWIGSVVTAIESGPEWSSTAIFITYDDCGCFYDHVAPPLNPDGTQEGPRSPMVIVSPWAVHGFTDSTPTSLAGILAFTEHQYGLAPLSRNDAAAYPYTAAFNFAQAPVARARMVQRPVAPAPPVAGQDPEEDPS
jgi:phospholipase C